MERPASSPQASRPLEMDPWAALSLTWAIGWTIAIPAVLLGFGGALMDERFGTSPSFLLLGLFLALFCSCIAVYRRVKRFLPSVRS